MSSTSGSIEGELNQYTYLIINWYIRIEFYLLCDCLLLSPMLSLAQKDSQHLKVSETGKSLIPITSAVEFIEDRSGDMSFEETKANTTVSDDTVKCST